MSKNGDGAVILVVHDVEETRDGMEKLLQAEGYRVHSARGEEDSVFKTIPQAPELILLNLGGQAREMIATGRRIRQRTGLSYAVPVVIFCVDAAREGEEIDVVDQVYVTRPDNFEQLRSFIRRLLQQAAG